MKKLLTIGVLIFGLGLFTNTTAQAQSDVQLEVGGSYITSAESGNSGDGYFGLQAGAKFNFSGGFGAKTDFTYFFPPGDGISQWAINVDALYDFVDKANLAIYPLAGVNFLNTSFENSDFGGTDVGFNVGAGLEVGTGASFYVEPKLTFGQGSAFVISGGIRFGI